ncbi:MAG: pirin family protein [Planctomycetes bacterium]|nr:pirin family protein [Planctomycetota bacterium]
MMQLRLASDRGRTVLPPPHDWLDSRHAFSFGDYYDPQWSGHRALRVLNDDRVRAASGFGSHPHRDMEIVSLVLDGALEHKDSIGTGSVIRPGDVQRMSAGSGIVHSEWNPSPDTPVHFLQIWFLPSRRGGAAGYEQATLPATRNAFVLAASGDAPRTQAARTAVAQPGTPSDTRLDRAPARGAVRIASDADLWRATIDAGATAAVPLRRGGHGWVHVATGSVEIAVHGLDGDEVHVLGAGDGAALTNVSEVRASARDAADVLVFDLG